MQQVVDLQNSNEFTSLGVQLLSISPDPVEAWRSEDAKLGITEPTLSDAQNAVWITYGTPAWMMPTNEPGHTFVLVGPDGHVVWVRDYGAPAHGGVMYVAPTDLIPQISSHLVGT